MLTIYVNLTYSLNKPLCRPLRKGEDGKTLLVKRIAISDIPKRSRRAKPSRFESTEAWKDLKREIDRGLGEQEAIQTTLTDDDKKKYRIPNRRTTARFIKKYIVSKKLKYTVKSFHTSDGESYFVSNEPPRVARKRRKAG